MLSKNQIKQIQSLQLKKFRDSQQLFIVEGIKSITEVLKTKPDLLKEVFATPDFIRNHLTQLKSLAIAFTEITETDLKKISLQASPNQVIAICHYFQPVNDVFNFGKKISLYLDDVRDPGNMGTIIRLADWFGISTLFCSLKSCDFYNPKVIQSTMGAFLRVAVVPIELTDLIKNQSVTTVYGAVLNGKTIFKEKLENGLIVIGNEANGINPDNLKFINRPITIPANQQNGTESLNAAMAAAIITSEFFRQLNT
jgi:RNA methyltransferase, TrmH family